MLPLPRRQILFAESPHAVTLERNELVALVGVMHQLSKSVKAVAVRCLPGCCCLWVVRPKHALLLVAICVCPHV